MEVSYRDVVPLEAEGLSLPDIVPGQLFVLLEERHEYFEAIGPQLFEIRNRRIAAS
jgi:hypothetical protein